MSIKVVSAYHRPISMSNSVVPICDVVISTSCSVISMSGGVIKGFICCYQCLTGCQRAVVQCQRQGVRYQCMIVQYTWCLQEW